LKKKFFISLGLVGIIALSISIGVYAASDIKLFINGKAIATDIQIIKGSSYVPLKVVSESLGAEVKWDGVARTISITSKTNTPAPTESPATPIPTPIETPKPTPIPTPAPKDYISKSDLPYTLKAKNEMSLTINSYTANSGAITFNFTLTNNSKVLDKGGIMTSTWDIYDGKSTLKYLDQDDIFYDTRELRSEQSITGNVTYAGLSQQTDFFTLYGTLWQYVTTEDFKLKFKVE
jgi:hypothetical protein